MFSADCWLTFGMFFFSLQTEGEKIIKTNVINHQFYDYDECIIEDVH